MAVAGVPTPREDHAEAIAAMALDMQQEIARFTALTGQKLSIRIGINTGPVVAGVIGIKTTYQRLRDKFLFEQRGEIQVKGKGQMVTHWLQGKFSAESQV